MNLAAKDIQHNLDRFALTSFGTGRSWRCFVASRTSTEPE
jgi:hypothetical protein